MKPADSYRAWLARRIEEGNDLDRVRAQIVTWKAQPPEGMTVAHLDALLAELDLHISQVQPKPKKKAGTVTAVVDAFG